LTVACVGEVRTTESTFVVTALLSGLDAMALSAEENWLPFCSSSVRLLVGVEALKNAFQSAVISRAAAAELALPVLAEGGAAETAGEEELELLEEQADMTVTAITRPSIVAERPWKADRATGENRPRRIANIISYTPLRSAKRPPECGH
jgi:hypothetical protein